jgi:hypothetical protein
MYQPTPPIHHNGPVSAMVEKLDETQRKKIDSAIISRTPHSLTAIHEKFKLAEKGVSYQSLCGYARKIRDQADKEQLLEKTLADEIDIDAAILRYIKRQTLEILMHQDPSMLDVSRATTTMQRCRQIQLAADQSRERQSQDLAKGGRPESGATPRLSNQQREQERRDAPWGRNDDGTPISHEQHLGRLNRVANFVYGINLPGWSRSTEEPAGDQNRERQSQDLAQGGRPADQNRERERPASDADPCEITEHFPDPHDSEGVLCIMSPDDPAKPGSSEPCAARVASGVSPDDESVRSCENPFSHELSGESFPLSDSSPSDPSRVEDSPWRNHKEAVSNDESSEITRQSSDLGKVCASLPPIEAIAKTSPWRDGPGNLEACHDKTLRTSPCLSASAVNVLSDSDVTFQNPKSAIQNPKSVVTRPNLRRVRVREDAGPAPRGTIYDDPSTREGKDSS